MILDKDFYTLKEVGKALIEAKIITRKTKDDGYHTVNKLTNLKEGDERFLNSTMPNGRSGGRKVSKEDLEAYIAKYSPASDAIREYSNKIKELEEEIKRLKAELATKPQETKDKTFIFEHSESYIPSSVESGLNKIRSIINNETELNDDSLFIHVSGSMKMYIEFSDIFENHPNYYSRLIQKKKTENNVHTFDLLLEKVKKKEVKVTKQKLKFENPKIGHIHTSYLETPCIYFTFANNKNISFNVMGDNLNYTYDSSEFYMNPESIEVLEEHLQWHKNRKAIVEAVVKKLEKQAKHKEYAIKLKELWAIK